MIDDKQLDEAHKVGDKVVIKHPSKDIKGKTGRIGEIRKGLYKGAPKTFTVDYDHNEKTGQAKSVQLKSKHIQGIKEQVENLQEKHRVSVTLSDPHHPAVTKRKELIQKTVRVKADNPGHAVDSAIHHFRKAGYKVHDHNYIGTVKEGAMPTFKEMDESTALERFRKAAAEREKEANKREAEMKARHASGKEDMKGAIDTLAKKMNNEEVEELDEISKELAGNYVGALAKKQLDKHGMKPNMYDKLPAKHKKGFDRAIDRLKEDLEESRNQADKYWDEAEKHKAEAKKHSVGSEAHHAHMANHYDAMHRYHSDLGQHREADKAADKAEAHHEKSLQASKNGMAEDVAVNNVGGGAIAGTQGDAGKKAVMTKKPLKRQTFKEFSGELTADEQFDLIEDLIQSLAEKNNVDSDEVWDSLESIDDEELFEYAIDAKGHKSSTGGLTQKGVDAYNRKTGGNLQTAVTTPPSKLKPGSKAAKRRKSFCARMGGMKKRLTSAKTANDPDSRINKALRKWNC